MLNKVITIMEKITIIKFIIYIMFFLSLTGCSKQEEFSFENSTPISFDENSMCEDLSVEDIKNMNNDEIEIIYLEDSSIVQEIKGVFTDIKILTAEDALKSLTSVRSIMNIEDFSFSCLKTESTDEYTEFVLRQLYDEIPVFNGIFYVTASNDGTPISVCGNYVSGIGKNSSFNTQFYKEEYDVNKESCRNRLKKSFKILSQELLIENVGEERTCAPIWRFIIKNSDTKQLEIIFMDGANGNIALYIFPNSYEIKFLNSIVINGNNIIYKALFDN